MQQINKSLQKIVGKQIAFQHLFSAEIVPFKQVSAVAHLPFPSCDHAR